MWFYQASMHVITQPKDYLGSIIRLLIGPVRQNNDDNEKQ